MSVKPIYAEEFEVLVAENVRRVNDSKENLLKKADTVSRLLGKLVSHGALCIQETTLPDSKKTRLPVITRKSSH